MNTKKAIKIEKIIRVQPPNHPRRRRINGYQYVLIKILFTKLVYGLEQIAGDIKLM